MKYVDLRFQSRISSASRDLPPYLGATLRGAFGFLLKQTVCQVAHGTCTQCILQQVCPYPSIFEGLPPPQRTWMRKYPHVPQPFVLITNGPSEADQEVDQLEWGVRLFGPACRFWPYVIHVFQTAGRNGIGQAKVEYELESVTDGVTGQLIHSPELSGPVNPVVHELSITPLALPEIASLRWRFHTPTRLTEKGACRITGLELLLAGKRRLQTMSYFYGNTEPPVSVKRFEEADFQVSGISLEKYRFSRFSGRQKQRMELQGVLGEIVISGPWGQLGDLLVALPVIHLGKSTSFGFGRVTWELA